jgi:ABC-2 type transport system permease protein
VLGYLWSLLRPLLLFTILFLVFIKFLKVNYDVPHSAVYLLLGIVLWSFFLDLTAGSIGSIVGRGDLIRKISIPRWLIVISTSFSAVISLFLNFVVIAVFIVVNHVPLTLNIFWFPLIVLELYTFGIGLALFLSAAFVRYRDVTYIWEVTCQALFYLTPLLYPVAKLHWPIIRKIIFASPLSQTIQAARYSVVTAKSYTIANAYSNYWARMIPIAITIVVFLIGVTYFKKRSKSFAEDI